MARIMLAVLLYRMFGVKIVLSQHSDGAHDFSFRRTETLWMGLFLHMCDRIITFSERGREILFEKYGRTEGVAFTPHPPYVRAQPPGMTRAAARRKLGLKPADQVILFVGRLMPYKGLGELMDSFRSWKPRKRTRLMLVGPIESEEYRDHLVRHADGDQRIDVRPGFVPMKDLAPYLLAADYGIIPYRRILHSGTTMLFSTYEIPLIVPDLGWFPEIFSRHEIGIMFPAGRHDGILTGLEQSLHGNRKKYQKAMRALCHEWSFESAVQSTLRVYETLR
jgi:glycosyltransferase involved in cell wall biosynthesis